MDTALMSASGVGSWVWGREAGGREGRGAGDGDIVPKTGFYHLVCKKKAKL